MTLESAAPSTPQRSTLAEVVRTLVWAFVIVLLARTFLWQPFNIPSGSMERTLLVGDYVLVSKYSYGYSRYSLPFGLPLIADRIWAAKPQRGDVAVFKLPQDNSSDYIKRVIGLPGDRIQMKKGVLHINGVPVKTEALGEQEVDTPQRGKVTAKVYRETLPGGRSYEVLDTWEAGEGDNTPEVTVPADHYFMMGDNRDDSTDSRFAPAGTAGQFLTNEKGVGVVPFENFVGRAELIFFSADGSAAGWEIWKWPSAIRWGRIFQAIE